MWPGAYRVLVGGGPERKMPLGRLRGRWSDNIKMNLQEMRQGGIDWIDLAQDRDRCPAFVIAVMHFWFP